MLVNVRRKGCVSVALRASGDLTATRSDVQEYLSWTAQDEGLVSVGQMLCYFGYPGECLCEAGWKGEGCELPDCPGEPDCNNNGTCDGDTIPLPSCVDCIPGWMGESCELPCGKYGFQNPPNSGICHCTHPCWHGDGCQEMCSGLGTCSNDDACSCVDEDGLNPGNWGEFCEREDCPGVGSPCSDHGFCTNDLECQCENDWLGIGCETPDCPGEEDCSGHGCAMAAVVSHNASVMTNTLATPVSCSARVAQ
ncbi:hypothetical protein BSL78_01935 [Apostichopus japonicus]|uniref:EGF-like domain-containing protein n=1 Tax=Stichopus japonicus TaxID=307972 RepID=A0A2G8LLR3_STIJA|nr:hypothetical protein BSL78_01935 [Apostichopus japonicus]